MEPYNIVQACVCRQIRRQYGITQLELAKKAGIPQSTLSKFERGGCMSSDTVRDRVVRALGTSKWHWHAFVMRVYLVMTSWLEKASLTKKDRDWMSAIQQGRYEYLLLVQVASQEALGVNIRSYFR